MTFDEMVEQSFGELEQQDRNGLDLFTENSADEEAKTVWRVMCLAALKVIEWRQNSRDD